MPKHTQRLSQGQWRELIEQWQSSGLSAKQFCHEQSLGYATFCKWRKRLFTTQPQAKPQTQPGFIDLGALTGQGNGGWNIVLHLGDGVELRLSRP